jgi:OFA family oxalate/formate antiporter-like MFS transporter
MTRLRLPADWPFDVRRLPFFYGWVIWLVSTLGFLFSIPGQTMGLGVFTNALIEALGLSRTQLSIAYFVGTTASALFLTRAGRIYDRVGARLVLAGSALLLAASLVYLTWIDRAVPGLAAAVGLAPAWIAFPLVLSAYFAARFSGQGVLTSASRNVLMNWFEARRGAVSSARGLFVTFGFSVAPLGLAVLIDAFGWRGALWCLAAIVGIAFPLLALVLVRDDPESCGLHPDGRAPVPPAAAASGRATLAPNAPGRPAAASGAPSLSAADARRDPEFWLYAAALGFNAMFGTAVVFHVEAVFAEAGYTRAQAFAYFLPQAVVSTSVNLLAGWLSDGRALRPLLWAMLVGFAVACLGLATLASPLGYACLVLGLGAGGGLWSVLTNVAFVRLYGRAHLGEISGLNASVMVFASAVGPVLFALVADGTGSWRTAALPSAALVLALMVATVALPAREAARAGT